MDLNHACLPFHHSGEEAVVYRNLEERFNFLIGSRVRSGKKALSD
jgi:hypothetical protein